MMYRTITAVAAALLAFTATAEARPDTSPRQAGTLTCNLDAGLGLVLGSVRGMSCAYDHYDSRGRLVRQTYLGTMNRAGLDLGVTSGQTLSWSVVTPGGRNHAGMLVGAFRGSSADATVVVGAGTQSLFGEAGIALQPVSRSGQVGLGLGFGVTALDLHRAPRETYASFRY